jgi:energy-converting hydrogenase Eha subunit H
VAFREGLAEGWVLLNVEARRLDALLIGSGGLCTCPQALLQLQYAAILMVLDTRVTSILASFLTVTLSGTLSLFSTVVEGQDVSKVMLRRGKVLSLSNRRIRAPRNAHIRLASASDSIVGDAFNFFILALFLALLRSQDLALLQRRRGLGGVVRLDDLEIGICLVADIEALKSVILAPTETVSALYTDFPLLSAVKLAFSQSSIMLSILELNRTPGSATWECMRILRIASIEA